MYLEHFKLVELPFSLTPNTDFFCQLAGHQDTLNVLLLTLRTGEGFIKVIGEVGTGKTLLCRMLLESLGDEFVTAYIPNPDLPPAGIRKALAQELGIPKPYPSEQHDLLELISERLLELNQQGKRVVLIIDEAQALPTRSLEALRLLTNLETRTHKLLQMVLFAQPELDEHLAQAVLRQLRQRISFSQTLPAISRHELDDYLCHRLAKAGYTLGSLFQPPAVDMLYRASQGIPRTINILGHKALMVAYGRGEAKVSMQSMQAAINDSKNLLNTHLNTWQRFLRKCQILLRLRAKSEVPLLSKDK